MRVSNFFISTLKEAPAEAEVASQKLMLAVISIPTTAISSSAVSAHHASAIDAASRAPRARK